MTSKIGVDETIRAAIPSVTDTKTLDICSQYSISNPCLGMFPEQSV